MGLFDRFGVGGGRLSIQPQSTRVTAGGRLAGVVAFQGGSRPQQITAVTLRLAMEQQAQQGASQGQAARSEDVVRVHPISGAFESVPNAVRELAFDFQLPGDLPSSAPGHVQYRLYANADIDGEIDPGASCEIEIVGGAQAPSAGMSAAVASATKAQMNAQYAAQQRAAQPTDPATQKKLAMDKKLATEKKLAEEKKLSMQKQAKDPYPPKGSLDPKKG